MKLSELIDLLEGKEDILKFKESNKDEFASLPVLYSKIGSSIPIHLIEDTNDISVNSSHIVRLCELFLEEDFSSIEVSYIADALLLSEKVIVSSESLLDDLETIAEFDSEASSTKDCAKDIISKYP